MEDIKVSSEKSIHKIILRMKIRIITFLLRENPNLYVNLRDKITPGIIASGGHDRHLAKIIGFLQERLGLNSYFIDIGANIGTIAIKVIPKVSKVYCYEPNPEALVLLDINLKKNSEKENYEILGFALGKSESITMMSVPKNNLGGSFINVRENFLSRLTLARKDNFSEISVDTHSEVPIQVKSAQKEFVRVLKKMDKNATGILKIDVEGMDLYLVQEFLKVLPVNSKVGIIFENHIENRSIPECIKLPKKHSLSFYKIKERSPFIGSDKKCVKLIKSLFACTELSLVKFDEQQNLSKGDYLILANIII